MSLPTAATEKGTDSPGCSPMPVAVACSLTASPSRTATPMRAWEPSAPSEKGRGTAECACSTTPP
eukprot:5014279-Prymnesium_polylepis.1